MQHFPKRFWPQVAQRLHGLTHVLTLQLVCMSSHCGFFSCLNSNNSIRKLECLFHSVQLCAAVYTPAAERAAVAAAVLALQQEPSTVGQRSHVGIAAGSAVACEKYLICGVDLKAVQHNIACGKPRLGMWHRCCSTNIDSRRTYMDVVHSDPLKPCKMSSLVCAYCLSEIRSFQTCAHCHVKGATDFKTPLSPFHVASVHMDAERARICSTLLKQKPPVYKAGLIVNSKWELCMWTAHQARPETIYNEPIMFVAATTAARAEDRHPNSNYMIALLPISAASLGFPRMAC